MKIKQINVKKLDIDVNKLINSEHFKSVTIDELFEELERESFSDKIFSPYYFIKRTIKDFFYVCRRLRVNVPKYWDLLKYDCPWDYETFYYGLIPKLKELEHTFEFDAHVMDAPRMLKQVKTARILAQRILADEYWENIKDTKVFPKLDMSKKLEWSGYSSRQDREYLYNLIKKYGNCWWD